MWIYGLILGAIIAGALVWIIVEFLPKTPNLNAVIERMGSTATTVEEVDESFAGRIGTWAHKNLSGVPGFGVPTSDLALLNVTPQKHLFNKVQGVVGGFGIALLVLLFMWVLDMPALFSAVSVLLAIPFAWLMTIVVDASVKEKAKAARADFAQSVLAYTRLVAAERGRGAPAQHALTEPAAIADSWVFRRIRQELLRARLQSQMPWNALRRLAEEIRVRELRDLADHMQLSGEEDAAVYDSLRAMANTLQEELILEDHRVANQVNERMAAPGALILGVLFAILLTPMLITLSTT